ncbi:hypothetical protein V1477_018786 [Vespula maculifrons]|uniref:Uncharacterized protein n=1 Tax=Vespula maculifrons TaxID=7453 RepID=A0ABD2AYY7_VESMC
MKYKKHIFHEYTWHDLRITNIKLNFVTFVKNKKQKKELDFCSYGKNCIDIQIIMNIIKLHKYPLIFFVFNYQYGFVIIENFDKLS